MTPSPKTVSVQYFALLREVSGLCEEQVHTASSTTGELYEELRQRYKIEMPVSTMKVAVNDEFRDWSSPLRDHDRVVFIQPVAGG